MATQEIWTTDARPLSRYSTVAIILHWAIALLILFNLGTGFLRPFVPRGVWAFHVSSGITVLLLTAVRVVWRLTHRPPPFPSTMPHWERGLAHIVHFLLYVAMVMIPLTGWAMISANPPVGSPGAAAAQAAMVEAAAKAGKPAPAPRKPSQFWGLAPVPLITPLQDMGRDPAGLPAQKAKHQQLGELHELGGWIMLALLFLHIGGALKHQFIDRQREFARMGIGEPDRVG